MTRKTWFVGCSILAHLGLGVGVFAGGVWRIDRLPRASVTDPVLAVFIPDAPAPAGQAQGAVTKQDAIRPRITQRPKPPRSEPPPASLPGGGGDQPPRPDAPIGTCTGLVCGEITLPDPPPVPTPPPARTEEPETITLPPTALALHRTGGTTQVHPSDATLREMMRDGQRSTTAAFRVCVGEHGTVVEVEQLRPSGYPAYDAALRTAIRSWTYRPFTTGGRTVRACSAVTFQYAMR
jgi:hypothetical protein